MSQNGYQPTFRTSLQQERTMDLYIETLTGTAFEMTVSPFDTVMSIKSKIQRVEGIPVSHQHLLYNLQELEDSACLIDYAIEDGATLKLVLSMRGGPISTRRLPPGEELAWKELKEFVENNREDVFERLPPGCRVTVLVFREGDQVNLFRVIENEDGTYSPLSESWSGSSIRNLFAEEEPDETTKRLQENSITMEKMQELRSRMEKLSLQKKPKKATPRVLSAKRSLLHNRRGTPRPQHHRKSKASEFSEVPQVKIQTNILQLPPINKPERSFSSTTSLNQQSSDYLSTSSLLQTQNHLHARRNREVEAKVNDSRDNFTLPLLGNNLGRRPQHQILPDILTSPIPVSASKKVLHAMGNTASLTDVKSRRRGDYGHGRELSGGSLSGKVKNPRDDLNLSSKKGLSVLSTPNIAIVEEENDTADGKVESDLSLPGNPIAVPSKEATTFTISQPPRERVTTAIGPGSNRFRVSRLILDENDRPKTSPDELTEHQKATQELCDILGDTKSGRGNDEATWWKKQRRRIHCSNSHLEVADSMIKSTKETKKEITLNDLAHEERKSTIELTLPIQTSLVDMTIRSPRYGRRSVMLTSGKQNKLDYDTIFANGNSETKTRQPIFADSNSETKTRQPRRRLSSGRGTLTHKLVGEIGHSPPSMSQELPPQNHNASKKTSVRTRCAQCRKRLNITNIYTCRCEKLFCAAHRYSELHNCTFDYKTEGRKILEQANPLVTAPKLPKI